MPTIDETKALVRKLFDGVLDKGGKPYADHCVRVMERLPEWCSEDERHAALLHDVVEDCGATCDSLRPAGYSDRTIGLVWLLTRRPSMVYMTYVQHIAESGDRGLIAIKLADNADNSDPERIACLPEHERGIAKRYAKARAVLEPALAALLPPSPTREG